MKILFVHQNMPSQFVHLAPALARNPANQVISISKRADFQQPNIRSISYQPNRMARASTHHYVRLFENSVLHGQQVARSCLELRQEGFVPDVIVAHPGWGEALFLKDVFPRSKLLNYCEFYYHGRGADVGFDPSTDNGFDAVCRARARNAHLLLSLEACDAGISPTQWQWRTHPAAFRRKISVIFDGIDTDIVRPIAGRVFTLPNGRKITREDKIVTFIARNLEPYRGFPTFMRAVPRILRETPEAQIVIVGGDAVSYGRHAPQGKSWREVMIDEVGPLDSERVHILPPLRYEKYLDLLRVSSAHVYLTVPFVLSWSCMEALAIGCLVIGSSTPPVKEVISSGENGLLVDFFSADEISFQVREALAAPGHFSGMRQNARQTILERYALQRCLPAQLKLVESLA